MPRSSVAAGARAALTAGLLSLSTRAEWEHLRAWAWQPVQRLSDMQPVTAAWWRERRKQPGDFLYLALGDSTAQGIGASTPGRSYVGQLADRIEGRLGAPIRVVNLGVSGATTALCARDQLPRAAKPLARQPDLVTVAIGANDIAAWNPVAFHRNLSRILDPLPGHTVLAELPSFHLPWNERIVHEANGMLHELAAARGLRIAPLYTATRQRGIAGILTEFAEDAFHPNDGGYEVWADALWPLVEQRVAAFRPRD